MKRGRTSPPSSSASASSTVRTGRPQAERAADGDGDAAVRRRALVARGLFEVAKFAARRDAEQGGAEVEVDLVAVVGAGVVVLAAGFAVRPVDEEGERL